MDLRQLRYFEKVVAFGSITKAADALHIAQPALTQQMQKLERDLGMELLERSVHGVRPTAAGQTLYRHALDLLRMADSTEEILRLDSASPSGRVSVAMASSTARVLAIPLAQTVRAELPGIVLEIMDAPSESIGNLVTEGRVQLGIAVDQQPVRGLISQSLMSEALHLIAWPGAPVPQGPISLPMLARLPIVLPGAPNSIRSRVIDVLQQRGLSFNFQLELTSTPLVLAAVINKLGVTVLPWSAVHQELKDGKVIMARIQDASFSRQLSLCWLDHQILTNAVEKVRLLVLQTFEHFSGRTEWAGERPLVRRKGRATR